MTAIMGPIEAQFHADAVERRSRLGLYRPVFVRRRAIPEKPETPAMRPTEVIQVVDPSIFGERLTKQRIAIYVGKNFGVTIAEIKGPRRDRNIVRARQITAYIIARLMGCSLPSIAGFLGGRDHTTALHSIRKIESLMEQDAVLKAKIGNMMQVLSPGWDSDDPIDHFWRGEQ